MQQCDLKGVKGQVVAIQNPFVLMDLTFFSNIFYGTVHKVNLNLMISLGVFISSFIIN